MFFLKGSLHATHSAPKLRDHCWRVGTNNIGAFGVGQLQGNIIFCTQQDKYTNKLKMLQKHEQNRKKIKSQYGEKSCTQNPTWTKKRLPIISC